MGAGQKNGGPLGTGTNYPANGAATLVLRVTVQKPVGSEAPLPSTLVGLLEQTDVHDPESILLAAQSLEGKHEPEYIVRFFELPQAEPKTRRQPDPIAMMQVRRHPHLGSYGGLFP